MGVQFDIVGIRIIVDHILGGMLIIFKECSFGDTVIKLGFYVSRWSYIDTTSKDKKLGEVLSLGCSFLNGRSNCIRFCKVIGKLIDWYKEYGQSPGSIACIGLANVLWSCSTGPF